MNKFFLSARNLGPTCSCGCLRGECQCMPECPCGCNTWGWQNSRLRRTCSCLHDVSSCPCPPYCRCGCNRWPTALDARCACGCRAGACRCPPQCWCGCNNPRRMRQEERRRQRMRATTGAAQCVLSQTGAYAGQDLCSSGTQCGWKYKCNPDFSCTLGADGLYSTPADCFGDAGKCGWKYSCVNNVCTLEKDGTYATQADC